MAVLEVDHDSQVELQGKDNLEGEGKGQEEEEEEGKEEEKGEGAGEGRSGEEGGWRAEWEGRGEREQGYMTDSDKGAGEEDLDNKDVDASHCQSEPSYLSSSTQVEMGYVQHQVDVLMSLPSAPPTPGRNS